jgi:ribosome biogenesis GTPase
VLEQHEGDRRVVHTGESLLAKFNRLARSQASETGLDGTISGFDGTRFIVRDAQCNEVGCDIRTALKKMLRGVKSPLCIGDRVRFQFQPGDGTSGVIVALLPRTNQLSRSDSHNRALEHIFAANVDRLLIIGSIEQPSLRPALIDRYLLIAHYNGIEPLIVLNKADLGDPEPWRALYARLGYTVCRTVVSSGQRQLDQLDEHLRGRSCVVAGQSGVGKSSLIRALAPDLAIRIGDISQVLQKGRHTTTSARSYLLPEGICLMDTPGIRECGIPPMSRLDVALHYRDIAALHHDCRFPNCSHSHEPGCAVKAAVEAGTIASSRYDSYRSIIDEDLAT